MLKLEEIVVIQKFTQGLLYRDFDKDELLKRAFVRSLEIIGEAVKQVPQDVKELYPDVEWKKIAGFRDILI